MKDIIYFDIRLGEVAGEITSVGLCFAVSGKLELSQLQKSGDLDLDNPFSIIAYANRRHLKPGQEFDPNRVVYVEAGDHDKCFKIWRLHNGCILDHFVSETNLVLDMSGQPQTKCKSVW